MIEAKRLHDSRSFSRREAGSIMPFIAMTVILLCAALGVCIDLQRDFQNVSELKHAAQSAAIYALSLSTNADGTYSITNAESNINAAMQSTYASINSAQVGPKDFTQSSSWSQPVSFTSNDLNVVQNPNPADSNDLFLQVSARRQGDNALKQFFLPVLFTTLGQSNGKALPMSTFSSVQTVEVIAQPASRIGAGAPLTQGGTRTADFAGTAVFPLAISNAQFAQIADPSQTATNYTIDLLSSKTAGNTVAAGHIKGCLVNLVMATQPAYSSAEGDQAIDQLEGICNYFGATSKELLQAPSFVERGSQLFAFDTSAAAFQLRQAEISKAISQIPSNRYYIIPVLSADPNFSGSNQVVGFARFLLTAPPVIKNGVITSFAVQLGDSVPVRNAVANGGMANLDSSGATVLPAAVAPFLPRNLDQQSGGMSTRSRGIVMAPCPSPRNLKSST